MANALPIGFDSDSYDNNNSTYISAFFKNGQDFIGQTNFLQIKQTLENTIHIDLINNSFKKCQSIFPNLSYEYYTNQLSFAKEQLNMILLIPRTKYGKATQTTKTRI